MEQLVSIERLRNGKNRHQHADRGRLVAERTRDAWPRVPFFDLGGATAVRTDDDDEHGSASFSRDAEALRSGAPATLLLRCLLLIFCRTERCLQPSHLTCGQGEFRLRSQPSGASFSPAFLLTRRRSRPAAQVHVLARRLNFNFGQLLNLLENTRRAHG